MPRRFALRNVEKQRRTFACEECGVKFESFRLDGDWAKPPRFCGTHRFRHVRLGMDSWWSSGKKAWK